MLYAQILPMTELESEQMLWGLITYQSRWGLSLGGWLVLLSIMGVIMGVAMVLLIPKLQPFLAYHAPITADALIVEGWVGDDALKSAIQEFESGDRYQILITTGIALERGRYLLEYNNFAELSQASLIALGCNPRYLKAIPTPSVKRDRTWHSAIAVRQWLDISSLEIKAVNVLSADVHSRRSSLLFKRVFEPEIAVGAIAHPSLDYEPQTWWNSSNGVRKTLSEAIAYIYAKFSYN